MKNAKRQTSIRMSDEAKRLAVLLTQKLGISQTDVIEVAIRRLAEIEGVK